MKILFVSSEAVPFIKSGGLADVAGALPKALKKKGHDVRVVVPRYWAIGKERWNLKTIIGSMGVPMGYGTVWCSVMEAFIDGDIPVYFIDHEAFFGRAGIYDDGEWAYPDNAARFGFFSKACLQVCHDLQFRPDIVHANDWQTALVPAYLKTTHAYDDFFSQTASVFSIHNMAYQGAFPQEDFEFLGIDIQHMTEEKFESYAGINLMKAAIFFADGINTVSPGYAQEIMGEPGANGLSPYLQRRKDDVCGILNGVDYDEWDPSVDSLLPQKYSVNDLSGKAVCKAVLQREFGLHEDPNIPVIGVVSRLTPQKGLHEIIPAMGRIMRDMHVQFVFVGTGEKWMEDFFGGLPARYGGRIGAWIGYNNYKAHLIEAGSDFFLMPSLFEPCGLNQIYSLRYGTLPIVRATGGLKDTVEQYDESTGDGTGFVFDAANPHVLYDVIGWAVSTYYDRPKHMKQVIQTAMKKHFCWYETAEQYEAFYLRARERRAAWR